MLIAEALTEEMPYLVGGILIVIMGLVALFVLKLKSIARIMVLVIVLASGAWVLMQLGVIQL